MSNKTAVLIANSFADGGGEKSSSFIMSMLQKAGYTVSFIPTKHISSQYKVPDGVEIRPHLYSGKAESKCDLLVFYANDACYRMIKGDNRKVWDKLLDESSRNVMCLNFVLGESWNFHKKVDKFLFLNRTKELEIIKKFKENDLEPVETFSLCPPVDLTPFLDLEPPGYDKIRFIRVGRYSGKYSEKDQIFLIEESRKLYPEAEFYWMATPPWMRSKYSEDKNFHMYNWNEMPVADFLKLGNLNTLRMPLRMRDQGPRTLAETALAWIPSIVEDRDGAKDRVTPETGWLIPASGERTDEEINKGFLDAFKEVLDDPGILEKKGRAARERALKEFHPFRWIYHITGEHLDEEITGGPILEESHEDLMKRQEDLWNRRTEFVPRRAQKKNTPKVTNGNYPKHKDLGFGNGNLREEEWLTIKAYLKERGVKRVLDIGGGYSCILFDDFGCSTVTLDNRSQMIEKLKSVATKNLITRYYSYPDFPDLQGEAADLCLISGPGPNNHDGRFKSMEFAKKHSDLIFLRDSTRPPERESALRAFPEEEWSRRSFAMSLTLFERKKNA